MGKHQRNAALLLIALVVLASLVIGTSGDAEHELEARSGGDNPGASPLCTKGQLQKEANHGSKGNKDLYKSLRGGACFRYVTGWDITGVTTEVDLNFTDGIRTACDCAGRCKKIGMTCANWVWKFTTDPKHRTCTLYSNFNLPPNVTIAYDTGNSVNIQLLQPTNNPQGGGAVPKCLKFNSTKWDDDCVSGFMMFAQGGKYLC